MLDRKPFHFLLIIISLGFYIAIGYGIQRHETLPLFLSYAVLFFLYLWVLFQNKENHLWLAGGLLFRAALLFSVPALTDDFYRFIWYGRLLDSGHHPFAEVTSYYLRNNLDIPGIDAALYDKLNSKINFTIYPPLSQFIFWLSVKFALPSTV